MITPDIFDTPKFKLLRAKLDRPEFKQLQARFDTPEFKQLIEATSNLAINSQNDNLPTYQAGQ